MTRHVGLLVSALMTSALLPLSSAWGQFPGIGDDTTNSLGQFEMVVNPSFQPFVTNSPGWNPSTSRFWSPVVSDSNTTIGRSNPFLSGSAADTSGTAVGTAGTIVADASFKLVPQGFQPPNGVREVHAELRSLDLSGGGMAVRAGVAAPHQPLSVGSVNSLSASGLQANDFPAQSFFDIFLEVDLPGIGTLSNSAPLVLMNTNLSSLPPRVIFTSGNTLAVPLVFETNNPAVGANAGDLFGLLLVAAHGLDMGPTDISNFQATVQSDAEMPVLPQYQFWAPGLTVVPILTGITAFSGNFLIQGQGAARTTYALEASTKLAPAAWVQSGLVLANSSGNFAITYAPAPGTASMFFRVRSR